MKTVAYNAMALCEPVSGVAVTMRGIIGALATSATQRMLVYAPRPQADKLPTGKCLQIHPAGWPWRSRALRILWEQACLPMHLRADGVHLLHAPAYVAPLAAPCPFILTVHDLHVFTHPQFCTLANRLHYRLLLPPSIQRAAAIIVFSEHVRHTLCARFPGAAAKTVVIPPGLDPAMRPTTSVAAQAAVRQQYGLPDNYLLFVGDLAPRKNLPRLLAAFRESLRAQPDLNLLLVGRALHGHTGLDQAVSDLGLQKRVRRLGYVSQAHLPTLYTLAAALVYPSYDEGFGLPALEAMACGCPVVTSAHGGPQEVCGDAATYCEAEDTCSIVQAMQAIFAAPDERRRKIAVGLQRASTFTWARAAVSTENLYRKIML